MAHPLSYKRIGVNKKNSNLPEQQCLSTEKEVFKAIPEKTAGLNIVQVKGVMLLWQHNFLKRPPAKPLGDLEVT
ncbi:MAG: hypothetical protein K0S76_2655 [Herbinix sp.]|jgi:hypothetical protein|nr:hypothetical protein [Herbinix sp.]MDF2871257.1 hypothetical protein [Anaerocolumna sp.]